MFARIERHFILKVIALSSIDKGKVVWAMAPVSTALHVTLSDGSLLQVLRDRPTPVIHELEPSEPLQAELSAHLQQEPLQIILPQLRLYSEGYGELVPQFHRNESVSLMLLNAANEGRIQLFSGTITSLYRS